MIRSNSKQLHGTPPPSPFHPARRGPHSPSAALSSLHNSHSTHDGQLMKYDGHSCLSISAPRHADTRRSQLIRRHDSHRRHSAPPIFHHLINSSSRPPLSPLDRVLPPLSEHASHRSPHPDQNSSPSSGTRDNNRSATVNNGKPPSTPPLTAPSAAQEPETHAAPAGSTPRSMTHTA